MSKQILVTGGSGFVASHILKALLSQQYIVVTTVRSESKGDAVLATFHSLSQGRLSYSIVEDVAKEGAFDSVLRANPSLSAVVHTASPFHDNFEDPKELLRPAIQGTVGVLKAIKAHSPSVKRVVVTSSFAAMINEAQAPDVYDESCWNPVSWEDAITRRDQAYRGSKKFAERAAWDFMEQEKPPFDLVTICPPMVYGPVMAGLSSLGSLNTSNQRILSFIRGDFANGPLPPTGTLMWVDVRDLALAHVRAIEATEASGKRFFVTAGHYSNKRLADAIRRTHPELSSRVPCNDSDELTDDVYGFDNGRAKVLLGMDFRTLAVAAGDTVRSLQELGA